LAILKCRLKKTSQAASRLIAPEAEESRVAMESYLQITGQGGLGVADDIRDISIS
jgi:hypothetical protein